ncbi:MAG: (deoxy)nucleoside triphosphate pyrophosphohydrolase [Desulfobacterales bacterium]
MMIQVTAAILWDAERVMIARRKPGIKYAGFWEFPGGKVERGESPETCLVREIEEEFSISVRIEAFFAENIHAYPDRTVQLLAFTVCWLDGVLTPVDHDALKWVPPTGLRDYALLPADRPLVEKLVQTLNPI